MAIINGVDMQNFSHKEIPQEKASFISKSILINIQKYRYLLGCPFSISMNSDALIRYDGNEKSEHYVKVENGNIIKRSTAIDGYPSCDIFKAWTIALSFNLFGGVGVYFDTTNNHGVQQPMLHLDLREKPLIWCRIDKKYYYPHTHKNFYSLLMYNMQKKSKEDGKSIL